MAKITTQSIRDALGCINPEAVTLYRGVYTYRCGFFFTHGTTAEDMKAKVENALTGAGIPHRIIDCDEQWKPFRGGDTLKQGSHWWVKFQIL